MSYSFYISQTDSVFASGSRTFSANISQSWADYGLTEEMAEQYASLDATFQDAYRAASEPSTRTRGTVVAKNCSREAVRVEASRLAKIISGNPAVTDSQRINLSLAVRSTSTAVAGPGMPSKFEVSLGSLGELTLTWKCKNPRGSQGTMYHVHRRIGDAGEFEYLGTPGVKQFVDYTLPVGVAKVTYQVRAIRSTVVGTWAEHQVQFGMSAENRRLAEMFLAKKAA